MNVRNTHRRPNGLTIVELLVVIGVIALILAVALPAVQSVRESGRRTQCVAHLGQFARALQAYESANKKFPSARMARYDNPAAGAWSWFSPHAHLLPYLEQAPLASDINLYGSISAGPWNQPPVTQSYDVPLPVFTCPSDVNGRRFVARNNLRVCTGSSPYDRYDATIWPEGGNGAFAVLYRFRPADFTDGLSNTVGVAEKAVGGGDPGAYHRRLDFWYSGVSALGKPYPNANAMATVCSSLSSPPPFFFSDAGARWIYKGYEFTWYNNVATPNGNVPDCSFNIGNPNLTMNVTQGGTFTATSYHPGGINCSLMDGSVRFISDNVDVQVWRSLGTRAGGEESALSGA